MVFMSGLCLGHSRGIIDLFWCRLSIVLAVFFGSLSSWKVSHHPLSLISLYSFVSNQSPSPCSWEPQKHGAVITVFHHRDWDEEWLVFAKQCSKFFPKMLIMYHQMQNVCPRVLRLFLPSNVFTIKIWSSIFILLPGSPISAKNLWCSFKVTVGFLVTSLDQDPSWYSVLLDVQLEDTPENTLSWVYIFVLTCATPQIVIVEVYRTSFRLHGLAVWIVGHYIHRCVFLWTRSNQFNLPDGLHSSFRLIIHLL